ncbi:MAG: hypothetical protein KGJ84_06500 [Elusimicrobia bacterium]|nr:hypothetical protein [Elusimicrobiota bacterium]
MTPLEGVRRDRINADVRVGVVGDLRVRFGKADGARGIDLARVEPFLNARQGAVGLEGDGLKERDFRRVVFARGGSQLGADSAAGAATEAGTGENSTRPRTAASAGSVSARARRRFNRFMP